MLTKAKLTEIAANPRLPSPPLIVLQVLEKAGRPDCTLSDLSRLLRVDPVLSGHLLKTANSALFGLPRRVSTIDRALALLGTKAVRSIVLSVSLMSLQRQVGPAPQLEQLWRTSVAGAVFARELAVALRRRDPDEDLLAGLLRDLGSLVLMQVCSKEYAQVLAQPARELAEQQCELEMDALNVDHAEVGAFVLAKWHLPAEITEAIRFHHNPDEATAEVQERAHLLFLATRFAQLHVTPENLGLHHELLHLSRDWFGIDSMQFDALLKPVETKTRALAEVLGVETNRMHDQSALVMSAIDELSQLVAESSAENVVVRQEKDKAQRASINWQKKARRLKRDAVRDPVTGAYNRVFFEEALLCETKRANRNRSSLGLMFIDVDRFKTINDRFGHPFGDHVLREVSRALRNEVRAGDMVSRFGGDEFCIIVPHASEVALEALANRLLGRLRELTIADGEKSAQVTVSIGAVVCNLDPVEVSKEQFLAAADRAMYQAKSRGKNQAYIGAFAELTDAPVCEAATVCERAVPVELVSAGSPAGLRS